MKPQLATDKKNPCLVLRPGTNPAQKTIVVLGVERGGTSMVAGVVRALGIDLGEKAGLNHEDPRFITDDDDQIRRRIRDRNKKNDIWGFKMPKIALKLDLLEEEIRNPYYIVVYRNIGAVADSFENRQAGEALTGIDRAMLYYNKIHDFMHRTHAPLLVVNYERANTDKATAVRMIADFIDVPYTDELLDKAERLITGDGKGYVNLPEHYFFAEGKEAGPPEDAGQMEVSSTGVALGEALTAQDQMTVWSRVGGEKFPENFWLCFDLDTDAPDRLVERPYRVYFDFIGKLFPAHCARPALRQGRNAVHVETNGEVKRVAIGPMPNAAPARITNMSFIEDQGGTGAFATGIDQPLQPDTLAQLTIWDRLRRAAAQLIHKS